MPSEIQLWNLAKHVGSVAGSIQPISQSNQLPLSCGETRKWDVSQIKERKWRNKSRKAENRTCGTTCFCFADNNLVKHCAAEWPQKSMADFVQSAPTESLQLQSPVFDWSAWRQHMPRSSNNLPTFAFYGLFTTLVWDHGAKLSKKYQTCGYWPRFI